MSEAATEAPSAPEEVDADTAPAPQPVEGDTERQPEPQSDAEKKTPDLEAELSKWRAMARKHEKDAKANAEAARKYAEFEESQKTEQQRLADRLAAAEQRAAQAEIGRARLVAAAAYNLPASLLDRIVGGTEEEINESAQALSEEIERAVAVRLAATPPPPAPAVRAPAPAQSRPVEALTPGAMPASQEQEDGNSFLRRMAGRDT